MFIIYKITYDRQWSRSCATSQQGQASSTLTQIKGLKSWLVHGNSQGLTSPTYQLDNLPKTQKRTSLYNLLLNTFQCLPNAQGQLEAKTPPPSIPKLITAAESQIFLKLTTKAKLTLNS